MAKSNEFLELQENEDKKKLRTTKPQAMPVTQELAEPKVDQRL